MNIWDIVVLILITAVMQISLNASKKKKNRGCGRSCEGCSGCDFAAELQRNRK